MSIFDFARIVGALGNDYSPLENETREALAKVADAAVAKKDVALLRQLALLNNPHTDEETHKMLYTAIRGVKILNHQWFGGAADHALDDLDRHQAQMPSGVRGYQRNLGPLRKEIKDRYARGYLKTADGSATQPASLAAAQHEAALPLPAFIEFQDVVETLYRRKTLSESQRQVLKRLIDADLARKEPDLVLITQLALLADFNHDPASYGMLYDAIYTRRIRYAKEHDRSKETPLERAAEKAMLTLKKHQHQDVPLPTSINAIGLEVSGRAHILELLSVYYESEYLLPQTDIP